MYINGFSGTTEIHIFNNVKLPTYSKTPTFEINDPILDKYGVQLIIKREDLNHPAISGNKWWKLRYNLEEALKQGHDTLLTFGGAYSNHIHATVAAAYDCGLKSIGIIRGEETKPLNQTLSFARQRNMQLHYISRAAYREKTSEDFINDLKKRFGRFYLIPEGGTNLLAVKGAAEFGQQLLTLDFDYAILPTGTGGTISGLICGFDGQRNIIGVPVLKDGGFLREVISNLVIQNSGKTFMNWTIETTYHEGGYAKVTPRLLETLIRMKTEFSLPLDQVYTGKMVLATYEEIKRGRFPRGSTILMIHTGGLQGAMPIVT